jgi:predicted kinase
MLRSYIVELVVFIGLQASGKSSFYEARLAQTHERVSKDRFRNNRNPERRQRQLVEAALAQGRSVVVDNTNPTVADRAALVALGRAAGARLVGYYFASTVAGSLERNARREGKARVPDVAIFTVAKYLQRPSRAEGFDELFYVRIDSATLGDPTARFVVADWEET